MEERITLDDCVFSREDGRLLFTLPYLIDLSGTQPITSICDSHRHYPNSHGDLVIGCDYVARYFRPGESLSRLWSLHGWPQDKGKDFYYNWPELQARIDAHPSAHGRDIILAIPEILDHAQHFLRWVNEYGEHS
jgi:hypothetical protein